MEKQIREFYAKDNLHIEKLISRRPANITPGQVKSAAVELYALIKRGEDVPIIQRAWRIWNIAKTITAEEYDAEDLEKEELKKISRQKEADLLRRIRWNHIRWIIVTLASAASAYFGGAL